MAEVCSCGNAFDGDNLCMPSACQWEGIERPGPRGISGFASCCINIGKPECRCADSTPTEREAGDVGEVAAAVQRLTEAVHSSQSDVADAAAVLVNVGDLRCLLRAERAAGAQALAPIRALVDAACHHCGSAPDDDGDHSCPCPRTDDACLDHAVRPVMPDGLRSVLAPETREEGS